MELLTVVDIFTQIVTVIMLASGIPPYIHMFQTKNTRNVPFIFFLLGLITAAAGVYYGILMTNSSLVNINLVGMGFNIVYVAGYLYVVRSKGAPLVQTILGTAVMIGFYWYLNHVVVIESSMVNNLGMFMFIISSLLLASPGLEVMDCIRAQSADGLSLSMLFGGLLCSATWLAYGLLLDDFYIYAPNIIGVITSIGKVFALLAYGGKKKAQKME